VGFTWRLGKPDVNDDPATLSEGPDLSHPSPAPERRQAPRDSRSLPLKVLPQVDGEFVPGSVALAHDYLNQRGGAERVALELAEMHPEATLSTSIYRSESTFPAFGRHRIRVSWLDRLPVDRRFRNLLPLYPSAMWDLGPIDADVLISSSSAWAHGIRTTERTFHAVYCHNPARWLYGELYMGVGSRRQRVAAPVLGRLRAWDQRAAARADVYIANSENTRRRIQRVYNRDAVVVPPAVDVDRFTPSPRGERLLMVSRLLPYKRLGVVVQAAKQAGLPLDIVGAGPMLEDLRGMAGPTVRFHGAATDTEVTRLMESCRALCLPGEEDFGMTPVEAQAAGKPVIAYGAGGALETVADGFTGTFFTTQTPAAFLEALARCDALPADHEHIAMHAQQFSRRAFRARIAWAIAVARGLAQDEDAPELVSISRRD